MPKYKYKVVIAAEVYVEAEDENHAKDVCRDLFVSDRILRTNILYERAEVKNG